MSKFINSLMVGGKKSIGEGIFYDAMKLVEKRPDSRASTCSHRRRNVKPRSR